MAGQLKTTSIAAPGFMGLNTQDSGVTLESGYATLANNCVIDKYGRLGARKGWSPITTNNGDLANDEPIQSMFEFKDIAGNIIYFSAGGGKLFSGTTTLTRENIYGPDSGGPVPLSPQPTYENNRWQFTATQENAGKDAEAYAFAAQVGETLLVNRETGTGHSGGRHWQRVGTDYGNAPTGVAIFDPDCCLAAFGRLWTAHLTNNKVTVFYSDLLDPTDFPNGGVLDVSARVGSNDEITALAAHNGYLIIFLKSNILIYSGADGDVANNLTLRDTITGVGCIARDSVQNTGTDLIFLSKSGVRSLNRTIQENSLPMRELSLNIRDDLVGYINIETLENIRSAYFERDSFYLITFPASKVMVYFDLRNILPNGAARTTIWSNTLGTNYSAFCATRDRKLLIGTPGAISEYTGYTDNGNSYSMKYYGAASDLGAPTQNKMLKKASFMVIGSGDQDFVFKYGYDYTLNLMSQNVVKSLGSSNYSKYNTTAKYNVSKYASVGLGIKSVSVPLSGSGKVIQFGVESTINNAALSIQKIDVYLQTGKIL